MGECSEWIEGDTVTVAVNGEMPEWMGGHETLRVPGKIARLYHAEMLMEVDVGDSIAWFQWRAADIDQSGHATFRFIDQIASPS